MSDPNRPSLQSAFHSAQKRMTALLEFASAAAPAINDDIRLITELCDSVVVLLTARLDSFFVDVVSLGTRHRERTVRRHLAKHGHADALHCDLPRLIVKIRKRVSFEESGKRLDNVFKLLFKCSVWPSDIARDLVLDLVLLRNLIVHGSGQDWSHDGQVDPAYARQFRRAEVLDTRRYGTFAVYSVDPHRALLFVREAMGAILEQLKYLEQRLVHNMSWVDP